MFLLDHTLAIERNCIIVEKNATAFKTVPRGAIKTCFKMMRKNGYKKNDGSESYTVSCIWGKVTVVNNVVKEQERFLKVLAIVVMLLTMCFYLKEKKSRVIIMEIRGGWVGSELRS